MKKIGIFDSGVETPEEIIMAAGLVPFRLFGNPTIEPDKANEHIPPTHCIWTRNLLEQVITGLDEDIVGIVSSHGCDRTNREFDIWLECLDYKFMYFLNAPRKRDDLAFKFFLDDLSEFKEQLEDTFKVEISDPKLEEAIQKMNKVRVLLKEISEYRSKYLLKGSEFHALVKKAQTLPKDEVLNILTTRLNELKTAQNSFGNGMKPILLTGSDIDDSEFLVLLENLGFHIIIDDLGVGTKYFWNLVSENESPIEAIAKYHLSTPIHSTKFPSYERFEVLKHLAEKYKISGVINVAQKFCEPVLYDHPYLKKKFKELGVPYLFVEMTYNRESYSQLSTRFSAFAEMI